MFGLVLAMIAMLAVRKLSTHSLVGPAHSPVGRLGYWQAYFLTGSLEGINSPNGIRSVAERSQESLQGGV